jgi:hypothetical protein
MPINAFLPFILLFIGWAIPWVKRKIDMRWGNDRYVTKMKSMGKYKEVWSGGEFLMHIKQGEILLVVFVTCMYGVGMPLMFPIAAFNFGI